MSAAPATSSAGGGFRPSFHLWLALLLAAFVFTGFGITYFVPMIEGTRPPDSAIVHLHGFAHFAWIVLLVVQSALVNAKNVRLHRSLGLFGIAVATLTATMGVSIMFVSASRTELQGVGPWVFWLNVTAPPSFAAIFILAIRALKTPKVHRDLILLATIAIIMPGMNRVYMQGLGIAHFTFVETYLTMDALVALVLWHQRRTTGTIAPVAWVAAAIVVLPQWLNYPVAGTDGWREFVFWLGSLAEYH